MSNFFNDLQKLFEKLPGIGPRQASRFIWALLDFNEKEREKFAELVLKLDKNLKRCGECFRAFGAIALHNPPTRGDKISSHICNFCQPNSSRDHSEIMVVERDSDLLNIEKAKIYNGLYHVLGGPLDPLEKDDSVRQRIKKLQERITNSPPGRGSASFPPPLLRKERGLGGEVTLPPYEGGREGLGVKEIILALSPTKMGEFTSSFIEKIFEPTKIKVTRLARGLSTGTDLEYADETTLRQALDNRK